MSAARNRVAHGAGAGRERVEQRHRDAEHSGRDGGWAFYIVARADAAGLASELVETNNVKARAITITP